MSKTLGVGVLQQLLQARASAGYSRAQFQFAQQQRGFKLQGNIAAAAAAVNHAFDPAKNVARRAGAGRLYASDFQSERRLRNRRFDAWSERARRGDLLRGLTVLALRQQRTGEDRAR